MKLKDTLHSIAGVYRCCTASWMKLVEEEPGREVELGAEIRCRWCGSVSRLTEAVDGKGLFTQSHGL